MAPVPTAFCTSCGSKLPAGTRFCTGCGASVATNAPATLAAAAAKPAPAISPAPSAAASRPEPPQSSTLEQAPAAAPAPAPAKTEAEPAPVIAKPEPQPAAAYAAQSDYELPPPPRRGKFGALVSILLLVIVLCALGAWYFWGVETVVVVSPPDARVFLDGQEISTNSPGRYVISHLSRKSHLLKVKNPGYADTIERIDFPLTSFNEWVNVTLVRSRDR
jgi:zinc ribbon protein